MTREQAPKHGCKQGRIKRRESGSKTSKALNGYKRASKYDLLREALPC